MNLTVAVLGFAVCTAALLAESPSQTPPLTATAPADDNPGYVDDPTAQAFILAELADNDVDTKDVKIEYDGTDQAMNAGVNYYRVTNVKTGKVWRVAVSIFFSESTADANI